MISRSVGSRKHHPRVVCVALSKWLRAGFREAPWPTEITHGLPTLADAGIGPLDRCGRCPLHDPPD